jgi:hypothetical protein
MPSLISVVLEKRKFDKALSEYLKANRRANAGLVEHTARKVVTGFSPRSASAKKVKGLRQFFYEARATPTKIKSEFRARESSGRGTLRPPKKWVSKKRVSNSKYPNMGYARTKRQAISWRSKRGTAWLQATMLYKNWRPSGVPKTKKFNPTLDKKHTGSKPKTEVRIRTARPKPFVIWRSNVPGVKKNKHYNRAVSRALKDARLDMMEYVNRKHGKIKMGN